MINIRDFYRKSIYTLCSGIFLLAGAKSITLPIIGSVNRPADTISYSTSAEEKTTISTVSSSQASISDSYQTSTPKPVYTYSQSTPATTTASAPQGSYVSFAGRSVPIFISYNTLTDSGSSVGLYNGRFLYGHNSANVFGALPSLPEGTPISVTLNGQTSTYTITKKITLEKSIVQNYMLALSNGRFEGVQYAYTLMTCAGTMYGNGDASHRTIIFIK